MQGAGALVLFLFICRRRHHCPKHAPAWPHLSSGQVRGQRHLALGASGGPGTLRALTPVHLTLHSSRRLCPLRATSTEVSQAGSRSPSLHARHKGTEAFAEVRSACGTGGVWRLGAMGGVLSQRTHARDGRGPCCWCSPSRAGLWGSRQSARVLNPCWVKILKILVSP